MSVGDFRETGQSPVTYDVLVEMFNCIKHFTNEKEIYREMHYELVVDTQGYIGSGSVSYKKVDLSDNGQTGGFQGPALSTE